MIALSQFSKLEKNNCQITNSRLFFRVQDDEKILIFFLLVLAAGEKSMLVSIIFRHFSIDLEAGFSLTLSDIDIGHFAHTMVHMSYHTVIRIVIVVLNTVQPFDVFVYLTTQLLENRSSIT